MLQESEGPRKKQSNKRYFNSVNLSTDVSLIALGIMACVCDRLFTVDRSKSIFFGSLPKADSVQLPLCGPNGRVTFKEVLRRFPRHKYNVCSIRLEHFVASIYVFTAPNYSTSQMLRTNSE